MAWGLHDRRGGDAPSMASYMMCLLLAGGAFLTPAAVTQTGSAHSGPDLVLLQTRASLERAAAADGVKRQAVEYTESADGSISVADASNLNALGEGGDISADDAEDDDGDDNESDSGVDDASGDDGQLDLEHLEISDKFARRIERYIAVAGVRGCTVPLTEAGYRSVVALGSDEQMRTYGLRVLASEGLGVKDGAVHEAALRGLVPYYSGTLATQSFEELRQELKAAAWIQPLPAFVAVSLVIGASGSTAPVSEAGYQLVTAMHSGAEMETFMRRVLAADDVRIAEGTEVEAALDALSFESKKSLARLRRELARRVADAEDAAKETEEEGTTATGIADESAALERELERMSPQAKSESPRELQLLQVGTASSAASSAMAAASATAGEFARAGAAAAFSEEGYQSVAALRSDKAMRNYIRALLRSQSLAVGSSPEAEGGLRGLAPYYSGNIAVQSFWRLEQELSEAVWVAAEPGSEGELAPLSLLQLQASSTRASALVDAAHALAVERHGIHRNNVVRLLGATAPFTEDGYKGVVALRNSAQMKAYVRRVLAANGRGIQRGFAADGHLNSLIQRYDGTLGVGSMEKLQQELVGAPWAARTLDRDVAQQIAVGTTGDSASLSEDGYRVVAALRSDDELKAYVGRLFASEGRRLKHSPEAEGFLNGIAPYYSGTLVEQSFARLRKELLSAPEAIVERVLTEGSGS